ncbi:glutaminase [Escherichia coli 95NR1]|nr:glutaminase [Escherichia coli 95NR1]
MAVAMDNAILENILRQVRPLIGQGKVADYIPALATVDGSRLGIAICTVDGQLFQAGDAQERFSIQSISKVLSLVVAMRHYSEEEIWQRVGKDPSGSPFNSLVQLEMEQGIPRNPFINAGALVVCDMLQGRLSAPRQRMLEVVRGLSGVSDISYDTVVARSEFEHSARNAAIAWLMKSFGNFHHDVTTVLQNYFHYCALKMSCVELARTFVFLANQGKAIHIDEPCDMLQGRLSAPRQRMLEVVRGLSGVSDISYDTVVARSEFEHSARNAAIAWLMKSFGNFHHDVTTVLQNYFHYCALKMSCVELARTFVFLANQGKAIHIDEPCDMLQGRLSAPRQRMLEVVRGLSGVSDISYDTVVARSEFEHSARNAAIAWLMKSFGNFHHDVTTVLQNYFHYCALKMSCVELARTFVFLANQGKAIHIDEPVVTPMQARQINALMATSGMYQNAGEFAWRVGLPAKSGVGGGIVAIVPHEMAIAVWSPELDDAGNSLAGIAVLEQLTKQLGRSVY